MLIADVVENFDDKVTALATIQAKIKELTERADAIKDDLRQLGDVFGYGDYDSMDYRVRVMPNRTMNKKRAVREYGEDVMSLQFDTAKAKKFLTGDEYEALYDTGAPKIMIVAVEDDE